MATGRVKFFDAEKGFGFITPDDKSAELFVHKSRVPAEIAASITADARVSYEVGEAKGKRFATQLALIAPVATKPPLKFRSAPKAELDFEEEFEREWGLRRAR
jgi:CspA family cold shock protein